MIREGSDISLSVVVKTFF